MHTPPWLSSHGMTVEAQLRLNVAGRMSVGHTQHPCITTSAVHRHVLMSQNHKHYVYIKPGGVPDKLCIFPADES